MDQTLALLSNGALKVTEEILREHPNWIFVYGDNLLHKGTGGAAALRHLPNTYGFVTKKQPRREDRDPFKVDEYWPIFNLEVRKFEKFVKNSPDDTVFLVSKIGSGLADRYDIWEHVIQSWWYSLQNDPSGRFVLLH